VVSAVDEFERATSTSVAAHSHDHGDDGHDHSHDHDAEPGTTTNEHVWFSLPTVVAVAERVAEELAELDAENAETYRDNARGFADALAPLEEQVDAIHDRGHLAYAQTEPIGAHLFESAHMVDRTPPGFLSALEEGSDPWAADLPTTPAPLRGRSVDFRAFNAQPETLVTGRARHTAEEAGLVVVELAETLPEGEDYVTWLTGIVDNLTAALDGVQPSGDAGH